MSVKVTWISRSMAVTRILSLVLLIAIAVVARYGTAQQQTIAVYGGVACVWVVFSYLGVRALLARKQVKVQIVHDRQMFALAARPQEEWLGLALACVGALILIFGSFTISDVQEDWSALGGVLIFISWYLIWRGAYAISVNGSLHYISLFSGYRRARLEDIQSAKFIVALHPTRPTMRFEIYPVRGEDPIVINRKIFRPKDIEPVVKWLGAKIKAGAGAARQN